MLRRLLLATLLTTIVACEAKTSAGPALRASTDSLMTAGRTAVQVYLANQDGSVAPAAEYSLAPEGTKASYAVVRDSAGAVLLLIETPVSPREWNIEYRHYFDAAGRTAFFRRYSGFFDGCDWGLARELLERSYTAEFELAAEVYQVTNDDGMPQDSARCEFAYHFPYEVYPTWTAAAAALRIPVAAAS